MTQEHNKLVDHTFLSWVVHREEARLNKSQGGERPWSADHVVAHYRFCNVHREDDIGTVVIKDLIRDPYDQESSPHELFQMVIFSRLINKPDTFRELQMAGLLDPTLKSIPWDDIAAHLIQMADDGKTVFSGAYMVTSSGATGMRKTDYAVKVARSAKFLEDWSSRQAVHTQIDDQVDGLGSFLAGQVVADLAYTGLLTHAPDHRTWAPIGPGAAKGANLARGRVPNKLINLEDYLEIGTAQLRAIEESGAADTLDHQLTMHDVVSNVNCETYKYHRLHSQDSYKGRIYK